MSNITEQNIMDLALESLVILVIGLVLWRIMARYSRKNNQPKGSTYFDTKYKKKWRRK
tara:strand:- start:3269 stop:3442 length:174 start_codon:yes stop_codon:yes gene_type:complete